MYSRSFNDAESSISARCRPEYSSTMASCTMVNSRWVAGLSTGMRAFSAIATMIKASSASPSETPQPHLRRHQETRHGRELRRTGNQRDREDDHDHRRFRQRGNHHLSTGADTAEAGTDIEPCQRQEEAGTAEERDDGNEIGRPGEQ